MTFQATAFQASEADESRSRGVEDCVEVEIRRTVRVDFTRRCFRR